MAANFALEMLFGRRQDPEILVILDDELHELHHPLRRPLEHFWGAGDERFDLIFGYSSCRLLLKASTSSLIFLKET